MRAQIIREKPLASAVDPSIRHFWTRLSVFAEALTVVGSMLLSVRRRSGVVGPTISEAPPVVRSLHSSGVHCAAVSGPTQQLERSKTRCSRALDRQCCAHLSAAPRAFPDIRELVRAGESW